MDICMLTPSECADLHELIGEYENVKRKLQTCLEKIEEQWQQEIKKTPVPRRKTERTDLPKSRLQILTEWIGHLDEQPVQLADMDEIVPRDPKPPVIKPRDEVYRLENYILPFARREELKTLIEVYTEGYTTLLTFLKAIHEEWEAHYNAEPRVCTNLKPDREIFRRLDLIDHWMDIIDPIDTIEIDDLDDYVE
jgi:hypothetical protein